MGDLTEGEKQMTELTDAEHFAQISAAFNSAAPQVLGRLEIQRIPWVSPARVRWPRLTNRSAALDAAELDRKG